VAKARGVGCGWQYFEARFRGIDCVPHVRVFVEVRRLLDPEADSAARGWFVVATRTASATSVLANNLVPNWAAGGYHGRAAQQVSTAEGRVRLRCSLRLGTRPCRLFRPDQETSPIFFLVRLKANTVEIGASHSLLLP